MQPKQTPVRTAALTVSVSTVRATVLHRDGVEAYYVTAVVDDTPDQRHQGKTYAGWTVGGRGLRADTSEGAAGNHGDALGALHGVAQA